MLVANGMLSATLILLISVTSGVHGLHRCEGTWPQDYSFCTDDQYCCGINNLDCCSSNIQVFNRPNSMDAVFGAVILLIVFVCCPWMCYRCCCRRTTSRGIVYSPAGTTTAVSVSLPPQGGQVPYPTVVPYPQQTPYPPQYPTNPYYGAPPPAYGSPVQAGVQQASAPPAAPPYAHS